MPQPSPLTSPGCGTSQRSMGRETQESGGPWRGRAFREPASHGSRWERGTAATPDIKHTVLGACQEQPWQSGVPGHSWAVLVLPSPLDDAVLPPPSHCWQGSELSPGRAAGASTTVPDAEQSPDTVNQGMVPQLPLPSGPSSALGSRASPLGPH